MIKLKSGFEIKYEKDFDMFFRSLLESMIKESRKSAALAQTDSLTESPHDLFLRELMDNCIYVTHQLFEISKVNADFSKFIVTGFIFNSLILNLPYLEGGPAGPGDSGERGAVH